MKNLVIFGAGGLARELAILIGSIIDKKPDSYCLWGFVVDEEYYIPGQVINGVKVLGDLTWLEQNKQYVSCVIGIGDAEPRKRIYNKLLKIGVSFETIIAPNVYIDPSCEIESACIIGHNCVISTNIKVGKGTFLNTDVMIGHDVSIGNFVTISPRATLSGYCSVGDGAQIGGGSYIIPHRKIGANAIIAAGSVVFTNVKHNTKVLGNPAKRVKL